MFNSGQADDHLYDFNTNLESGQAAPGTSGGYGNRGLFTAYRAPGTSSRPLQSSMGKAPQQAGPASRMGLTTAQGGGGGDARPMTSVSGAGFKSDKSFDPLNIGKGPAPPLADKSENSFEDKAKDMEKGVHRLIEASAQAVLDRDIQKALEKAKEAGKAERALCKFRESHSLVDQINLDLTYAICFNLANAYYHNKMYDDALNTYQLIVKNKQYPQSGRLRVNMGNIYYDQKKFPNAIKMYRMALDQIPATGKELRFRIMRNIGNAFVKLGQFQDAIDSFEAVMTGSPDVQTAFNLLLCLYARGDKDKVKKQFVKMLSITIPGMTEDDEDKITGLDAEVSTTDRHDALKDELTRRHERACERILAGARLIAPMIDDKDDWVAGYKWVMEQMRTDYEALSSKLELDLAMEFMKKRQFDDAIDVLKGFEKKDASLRAMAAANLSFIYFLEGEYQQADKQADIAVRADRYNAKALVNKGNCMFMTRDFQRAREMYLEAVGVEADCIEAIFNLGLVNLELNAIEEAKNAFDKLHTILPSVPEALFQLGAIHERQNVEEAAKTFERLLTRVPGDPNLCSRLGIVYEKLEDDNTACHWQTEAHRHYPVNLNVISWLGVWYVKREMYEQAIEYFERAAMVQPGEVKWRLMITSCYRRLGDFYKALELYQQIHEDHPENIESLQYLEALCKDLGRPHEDYTKKLEKLRRNQPQAAQAPATGKGGAATQAGAPPAQLRSERPAAGNTRSERPGQGQASQQQSSSSNGRTPRQNTGDDAVAALEDSRSPLSAPRGVGQASANNRTAAAQPAARSSRQNVEEEDDFGGTDVASMLG